MTKAFEVPDLGKELASADWVREKASGSAKYAQSLYAALCNNRFRKLETASLLREDTWNIGWLGASKLVSKLSGKHHYEYFCSGKAADLRNYDYDGSTSYYGSGIDNGLIQTVFEGHVVDPIKEDLQRLGWIVLS